jgi:putative ABC transport system permease protein
MKFMKRRDLKFNMDNVLVIKSPRDDPGGKLHRMNAFKEEVSQLSMIRQVSSTNTPPGATYRHEVYFKPSGRDTPVLLYMSDIDEDFFGLYGISFLAGKNFSKENPGINESRIVMNRSAARMLGFDAPGEAVGQIVWDTEENAWREITGIVDDYHQRSMKEMIEPQVYRFNRRFGDISLKINPTVFSGEMQKCISDLNRIWKDIYRDLPFEYYFLDEQYNEQYLSDVKFEKLFRFLSAISIFIACSGLLGLSLYIAVKRRREVGIRKVFGAGSSSILALFAKDYLKQLMIAVCIGTPAGYFLMKEWLIQYSYRTSVGWLTLLLPSLFLSVIFLSTVAFHIIRSSRINPVFALKEEP